MGSAQFDFSGQGFIVTGASSGIGHETARMLLASGANVLGLARHMTERQGELAAFGERFVPRDVDVTEDGALSSAIEEFVADRGPVSGSVHGAGMAALLPLRVWQRQELERMMTVNLWAGMSLLKLASHKKRSLPGASHVFLSSVSAHRGQPGLGIYAATKGALEAMVRTACLELTPRRQRVNSICLGWVDTPMTKESGSAGVEAPLGVGEPKDAASLALYLLSDSARWVTGANFVVDGGYLQT